MTTNGRNTRVAAIVLGVVAIAGCSSGSKPTATTATTTIPRGTTSTTTRRREHPSTTTTTKTPASTPATNPVAPGASAAVVSASFASPTHGWALASDGHLDETTDSGHTWHRTGHVPSPQSTIRFLSDADGFAFTRERGPLLITHDAGATWTVTPTPFPNIFDLAIARGTIDVSALQPPSRPAFRIWTSPVAHLAWKQVPPAMAVGAGPVASQQIVLNGGHGWILGVNRTVIAAARTSGTAWARWTPPCLHVFGPAYLSASTGTDLVASCDEGVWGGHYSHITPTVWFSHDRGTTFVRKPAPVFGPVLSPNAHTAVVAGNTSLQRTTDGGATWTSVGSLSTGDTTDWGFTTSTQGFVIRQGEMLMTRDAAASWQRVTLP
jgi:photosystem II stability/assembly factor-like uncharacterized protein